LHSTRHTDFKAELNAEQYAAVTCPPAEPMLVLAGAGSGKTRTLTYRVAWLIKECALHPWEILLLTFTNKAAREMLTRIEVITGRRADEFWGGTFHSVALRMLRSPYQNPDCLKLGLHEGFSILDADDASKLVKKCTEEMFPSFFDDKDNPRHGLLADIISYARNTCKPFKDVLMERYDWLPTAPDQIEEIAAAYAERKLGMNVCDFDDLLVFWLKLLTDFPEVLERCNKKFKNILVDEYQDTNTLQCRILDKLAGGGRISAVGDHAQCIYSWRGANIENIMRFKARYPDAKIFKVEQNYRSTPEILNFANQVIDKMEDDEDYKKNLVASRQGGAFPIVMRARDTFSQSMQVVNFIESLTRPSNAKYSHADIAILYRSHYHAMDMQLSLQKYGVPFAITSGLKFFEQAHIKDVIAQIKFAANPKDIVSFSRFMMFLPKVGEKTAEKLYFAAAQAAAKAGGTLISALSSKDVLAKVPKNAKEIWPSVADGLAELERMVRASRSGLTEGLLNAAQVSAERASQGELFKDAPARAKPAQSGVCGAKDIVKSACQRWYIDAMKTVYEDWRDRSEDFDSLYEYAGGYEDFDQFLSNAALEVGGGEKPDDAQEGKVRMMTVHQAKGLEFPVVFVIGAADGMFPIQRCIDEGSVDEERRLFYVACTRAKDLLVISYPQISSRNGNFDYFEKSRFIDDIESDSYETNY